MAIPNFQQHQIRAFSVSFDLHQHKQQHQLPQCCHQSTNQQRFVMPQSITPMLRAQLLDEIQQLRLAIFQYLQHDHQAEYKNLLLKLESHPLSHWPELLNQWLTPELEIKTRRLEAIQAALSQMDMGLYGLCCDCDSRIERHLLLQDPARQRCAHCEKRHQDNKATTQIKQTRF